MYLQWIWILPVSDKIFSLSPEFLNVSQSRSAKDLLRIARDWFKESLFTIYSKILHCIPRKPGENFGCFSFVWNCIMFTTTLKIYKLLRHWQSPQLLTWYQGSKMDWTSKLFLHWCFLFTVQAVSWLHEMAWREQGSGVKQLTNRETPVLAPGSNCLPS